MNRKPIGFYPFLILVLSPLIGCGAGTPVSSVRSIPPTPIENTATSPRASDSVRFVTEHRLGIETARRESKPLLLFFSLPNCGNSKRMQDTTFSDAEVRRLSDRFVCVSIDGATDTELCEFYAVKNFPTTLILNAQGTELQRLSGKQTPAELVLQMHVAIQSTAAKGSQTVRK